jgi:Lipase (class 3)
MMATYNIFQQVATLSIISNVLFQQTGDQDTLQGQCVTDLQTYLPFSGQSNTPNPAVTDAIGNWQVVWGPMIWKDEPNDASTPASNVIYVAQATGISASPLQSTVYVVAIAGTPLSSESYDLWVEDAGVTQVVNLNNWLGETTWPTVANLGNNPNTSPPQPQAVPKLALLNSSDPYVALGTASGVYNLLSNTPPAPTQSQPSPLKVGTNLMAFLAGITDSSSIIFTGHSLGGALAPVLAYVLQKESYLNNTGGVYVYPTAGPSPGNAQFAADFASTFPVTSGYGYQVWNSVIYNTLDIVPCAWCVEVTNPRNLGAIPTIYGQLSADTAVEVSNAITLAEAKENLQLEYIPLQGTPFWGTYQTYFTNLSNSPTMVSYPPSSVGEFMQEALYQHMLAYANYFNISLPLPPLFQSAPATNG